MPPENATDLPKDIRSKAKYFVNAKADNFKGGKGFKPLRQKPAAQVAAVIVILVIVVAVVVVGVVFVVEAAATAAVAVAVRFMAI